ncbi:REP-associated tyrosine transposase [Arenimonas caeni]|jgi:REP element-mobilizing transposase RayT|uniref:Transposase n=1 Tax=Arenimonas caeni TaxID=2058085 RepID=A0A2P6M7X4_9GAMM|nr:transposase [Arenimonas caeni]MDY0022230.1 transposase [Arenimonas caeni]PRH82085.1 transposase [Arenimonas caeni]
MTLPKPLADPVIAEFRRVRLQRRSVPGQTYLLAVSTLYCRPVFEDDEAARAVCRVHTAHWPWRDSTVLAWVLMPDRWQGLVTLGERDSLSTLVGRFKSLTSRAVEDRHRVNGWLWGRGFEDRVLRPDEAPMAAARHLVGAPLRAGLVRRLGDYAYWNTAWLDPGGG